MNRISLSNLVLALFLVVPFLLSACGGASVEAESAAELNATGSNRPVVRVNTIDVVPQSFEEIIPVTGVLVAPQDASLSAQSAGTVIEIVEIGARVEKGGVVARLDDRLIKAALEQAKATRISVTASADLAEDLFKRQEPLYKDSIISAIEFEQVRSQLNQARAALAQAKAAVDQMEQQLENTFVRAPFSGTIEERLVEKGEQLVPGAPVVRIVDTGSLKIQAGVPERYAADIRVGTPVQVSLKAYGGDSISSKISFVGNVIHPKNRTFMIEVSLSNTGKTLKPEMIVDLLITQRVLKDQIVLPQTAIIRDEKGTSVYVVENDGTDLVAMRLVIETGASYGGVTVVTSGLKEGHKVITVGQTNVSEGDLIDIEADPS